MKWAFYILSILSFQCIHASEKVTFLAGDGLRITADVYIENKNNPFIILLHQANYSRGEYIDIAPRLVKLGFNCMAIDLRAGNKINFVENETAELARLQQKANTLYDAKADIEAAIRFVRGYTQYPVILLGSSYSASLSLVVAAQNNQVEAVVAFSPGEYFSPDKFVKDEIKGLKKPLFIASSEHDFLYISAMLADIPIEFKTFYTSDGESVQGAKALWPDQNNSEECWFNLILFLNKFK